MITCCFNCTERTVGCHATCKRYMDEKVKYEAQKLAIEKVKAANNAYYGYLRCNASKARKRMVTY